jgi:hypothetical protein
MIYNNIINGKQKKTIFVYVAKCVFNAVLRRFLDKQNSISRSRAKTDPRPIFSWYFILTIYTIYNKNSNFYEMALQGIALNIEDCLHRNINIKIYSNVNGINPNNHEDL